MHTLDSVHCLRLLCAFLHLDVSSVLDTMSLKERNCHEHESEGLLGSGTWRLPSDTTGKTGSRRNVSII